MSIYLDKRLQSLTPYTPGEQPQSSEKFIKLNTNESPYFPSKYSLARINSAEKKKLRLYSDPESGELARAIAEYYGVTSENVMPVNGSDEALAFCFAAFGDKGAVFPDVTYGFYKVFAGLFDVKYTEIPLKKDFSVNVKDYLDKNKTVFLANPNAQTGMYLPLAEIETIVSSNPKSVVVIDEAYVDFGGVSAVKLIKHYKNLVVVQTFSKSRSLAGARVGFAVADKELIADLQRVKYSFNPYNVNRLSAALATEAIKDRKYFGACRKKIMSTREKLTAGLKELGFEVLPSKANFVLAQSDRISGGELYKKLKEEGVLVRHFSDKRIDNFVRITIGTDAQIKILLNKIKNIMEAQK